MTIALASARPQAVPGEAWRHHLGALALAAFTILALFVGDVADLVHIWWTSATFGHCLFIAPIDAWLVWGRRHALAAMRPAGWWPGLAIVAVGGAAWLIGDAGAVALARQAGLVTMIQGLVVTILGPHVARALAFPLAYLWFAVPFGDQLEPPLQSLTVSMVMPLLALAGIPASVDGVLIHAGRYWFEIAEACSGAQFVIAMLAYGALVANIGFRSWWRRGAFLIAALVIPVLANAVRAFATIWLADRTSLERATGFDHILFGWVFFGLVMLLVTAAGWRWFDRAPGDAVFDPAALPPPARHRLALGPAALLGVATALAFPAWSVAAGGGAGRLPARIDLPAIPGWTRAPLDANAPWQPYHPGADHVLIGRYVDRRGDAIELAIAAFARQREGAELVAFGTGALREGDRWVRIADAAPIAAGRTIRIRTDGRDAKPVERVVATWYRVGDTVTADEALVKLATTRAHLTGGDATAVALHVAAAARPGGDPRAAIARFVAAAGGPARLSAAR